MIKGCLRDLIVLRDTESPLYEEAYFLLRPSRAASPPPHEELVAEANRIIGDVFPRKKTRKGPGASALWFLSGLAVGVGLSFLLLI